MLSPKVFSFKKRYSQSRKYRSRHSNYKSSILEGSVRMFVYQESKMVFWGHSSILRAEMDCLRQLLINDKQSDQPWRYFFNLAGSELPLKSEEWARQMLKGMNGQSLVEGFPLPEGNHRRLTKTVILKWYWSSNQWQQ